MTVNAQKLNETKSTSEVQKENVPDAYFFGFLDFSVDKKSGYLTYLFHNNTSGAIQWVNITGKWLDNNGNIVGEYSGNISNLASGDKYKAKSIFIPKEATSIRLETLNVSEQYVGSGDYKVKKIDLTSIVPVSSLSKLKKSSHSYFVTTGFTPDSNNKTNAQSRNQSGCSYDENSYGIAKQIISKDLKAPSTVKWTEVKMMAKDDYHRYIYSVIFEAQNDYGTYLHHEYFVKFRMASLTDFAYNTISYVKQSSYRMNSESETLKMLKGEKWNQEPKPGDYF